MRNNSKNYANDNWASNDGDIKGKAYISLRHGLEKVKPTVSLLHTSMIARQTV